MTKRLDSLYDLMIEVEERIEDAKLKKNAVEMQTISLENIYAIMQKFSELYDIITDEEKKAIVQYLIKEIQIYPKSESSTPLKSIEFNFPIFYDGEISNKFLLEMGKHDETVVCLTRK